MKTGYYLDPISKEFGFEFLENINVGNKTLYDYLHGECYDYANVMHEFFGYKVVVLYEKYEQFNQLVHVANTCDVDGVAHYIDVRGMTDSIKDFVSEFEDWWTLGAEESIMLTFDSFEEAKSFLIEECIMSDSDFLINSDQKEQIKHFITWGSLCEDCPEMIA